MQDNTAAEARQPADAGDVTGSDEAAAEGYNDDALATMAEAYAAQADHLFRLARGARQELLQRLVNRDAKVIDTPHWTGKVKPGLWHHAVDDVGRFRQRLRTHVSADDIEAAFVQPPPAAEPPIRVDHRALNELVKRGGLVAEVIGEERTSQQGDPSLELKRKPEPLAEEEVADGPGTLATP